MLTSRGLTAYQVRLFDAHSSDSDLEALFRKAAVVEPAFYAHLRELGASGLPNFSLFEAITFDDDVVVAHLPIDNAVLFHELVHVTQYRLLGVEQFTVCYIHSFVESGSYEGIPLEVCARELVSRYTAVEQLVDVEKTVLAWGDAGHF